MTYSNKVAKSIQAEIHQLNQKIKKLQQQNLNLKLSQQFKHLKAIPNKYNFDNSAPSDYWLIGNSNPTLIKDIAYYWNHQHVTHNMSANDAIYTYDGYESVLAYANRHGYDTPNIITTKQVLNLIILREKMVLNAIHDHFINKLSYKRIVKKYNIGYGMMRHIFANHSRSRILYHKLHTNKHVDHNKLEVAMRVFIAYKKGEIKTTIRQIRDTFHIGISTLYYHYHKLAKD